ncbi:MAG: hypothetical protein COS41_02740 [Elusimicrobia bacterium CG03_land_8_20_14_0_80_50_18]|nr:MAG: hypothetical protein COS41_02740 [Elusimicrobia bacterium CG03_land_8_20_14_0_80_50_18]PIX14139.1 MAG: hypothetical protein COZ72_06765 [Elusimicrobia bacterium CG_4_8_14_3_um_filter_50_9]
MLYFLLAAYNEAESIEPVFASIKREIGNGFAILLVDDGSTDLTSENARTVSGNLNVSLELIRHPRNLGLGAALRTGFEWIGANASPDDIVVTMDCDDTHPPETVRCMIEKLESGCGAVIASRFVKGGFCRGVSFARSFISRAGSFFMSAVFHRSAVSDWTSGFRAYNAGALKKAGIPGLMRARGFSSQLEILFLLLSGGAVIGECPLRMDYSLKKSSSKMRLIPLLFEYSWVFARVLPLMAEKFLTSP